AAVGGGITRQVSRVHADAPSEAHEIKHVGPVKPRAPWHRVDRAVDVLLDRCAAGIHVVAILARLVPAVLLLHAEMAVRGGMFRVAAGNDGHADEPSAAVEK